MGDLSTRFSPLDQLSVCMGARERPRRGGFLSLQVCDTLDPVPSQNAELRSYVLREGRLAPSV